MRRWCGLLGLLLAAACGGQQTRQTSELLFDSPVADQAREHAPDLYANARKAWSEYEKATAEGRADAADLRTVARLWFAAAVTEAERVELERRRFVVQQEEERWGKQLARDRDAAAEVARQIALREAQEIALKEAALLSSRDEQPGSEEVFDALRTRFRFELALARALGAPSREVERLEREAEALDNSPWKSAAAADRLLSEASVLVGEARKATALPRPGAAAELVESAEASGFSADQTRSGVIVRSDAFFRSDGAISMRRVQSMKTLVGSFPHGAVVCQIVVPNQESRAWSRRSQKLAELLTVTEDAARVSVRSIASSALPPGTTQCTFVGYGAR